jgi:hypothetical protein
MFLSPRLTPVLRERLRSGGTEAPAPTPDEEPR